MDLTISQTLLPYDDPHACLAFYRDVLGFEVRKHVEYQDLHWITVGPPGQPATSVVLNPPGGGDPGVTEEERRTITEMMAKGTFAMLVLSTPDVDAAFEQIAGKGAEVVQEPMDMPYGVRDCAVRDPAGNLIRIQQQLPRGG